VYFYVLLLCCIEPTTTYAPRTFASTTNYIVLFGLPNIPNYEAVISFVMFSSNSRRDHQIQPSGCLQKAWALEKGASDQPVCLVCSNAADLAVARGATMTFCCDLQCLGRYLLLE
jgi:hypothetical protein